MVEVIGSCFRDLITQMDLWVLSWAFAYLLFILSQSCHVGVRSYSETQWAKIK